MAIAISAPYPNFFTTDGKPLEGGYVYIGDAGLNPLANPQQAYWDEALTIPAPAEIRVTGGYIVYNGSPARLYTPGDYSILVADKNGKTIYSRYYNTIYDADLFLTEARGTLTRSMRTPSTYNINNILDGGYYSWTNAGTSNYPTGCGAADLFALEVLASPDGAGIVYQRIIDFSLTFNTRPYAWERKSINAGSSWSTWQLVGPDEILISAPATPYTVIALHNNTTILVTTGASAFVCNLPAASSVIGHTVNIVKIDSGAGAIQIAPNGADAIANAGNVSVYIGGQYRNIKLLANASGNWSVIGGEWQPSQAVDTNGSHLALGRLHLLPLNNITSRDYSISPVSAWPAAGNWSAAIQITGNYGIPSGANAICAKIHIRLKGNASPSTGTVHLAFSDNNSNVPTEIANITAHPMAIIETYLPTAALTYYVLAEEVIIPLNSLGQLYLYVISYTGLDTTGGRLDIVPVGYYMGD